MGTLFKVLGVTSQNWPVPEGFETGQSMG
jgi:hypothetical protein